jgi:sodium-dependent dicarboxylate transporter 2/3/5
MEKNDRVDEAVETYSRAEMQFNRRRQAAGLLFGPLVFAVLLLLPMPALSPQAHRLAAVMALVVILWITEALPMPATALLGPALAVALGIAPARDALGPFADPIIFLFIGSFVLAEAMFVHRLDRRIAYTALSLGWVGRSPIRVLAVYGGIATVLSMWISNTATTAMMFPIGISIVAHLRARQPARSPEVERFALAMMLVSAFGASIGGIGTPVGTPPNLIGIGILGRTAGVHISFFRWMMLGVPLAGILFAFLVLYFRIVALRGGRLEIGSGVMAAEELRRLGQLSRGQRNVLIAFGVTIALWLTPGILALAGAGESAFARGFNASVPESVAAILGALLLFILPVDWEARRFTLRWEEAVRIDWGIILLFGGGLSLGGLAFSTGLAESVGRGILAMVPAKSSLAFTMIFTALAIVTTEVASNTASATMIVPIAIAVAQAAGINPLGPALGATLGASMAFMLPISTPPNAIVYSSGYVPITSMIRHGLALDVFAFAVIVTLVSLLGPLIAG